MCEYLRRRRNENQPGKLSGLGSQAVARGATYSQLRGLEDLEAQRRHVSTVRDELGLAHEWIEALRILWHSQLP